MQEGWPLQRLFIFLAFRWYTVADGQNRSVSDNCTVASTQGCNRHRFPLREAPVFGWTDHRPHSYRFGWWALGLRKGHFTLCTFPIQMPLGFPQLAMGFEAVLYHSSIDTSVSLVSHGRTESGVWTASWLFSKAWDCWVARVWGHSGRLSLLCNLAFSFLYVVTIPACHHQPSLLRLLSYNEVVLGWTWMVKAGLSGVGQISSLSKPATLVMILGC